MRKAQVRLHQRRKDNAEKEGLNRTDDVALISAFSSMLRGAPAQQHPPNLTTLRVRLARGAGREPEGVTVPRIPSRVTSQLAEAYSDRANFLRTSRQEPTQTGKGPEAQAHAGGGSETNPSSLIIAARLSVRSASQTMPRPQSALKAQPRTPPLSGRRKQAKTAKTSKCKKQSSRSGQSFSP